MTSLPTPTTTTVMLPGGIRRTTETRVLSITLLPFIRSRRVHFKAEGLLPGMRHRPLFDNVDVSAWCKQGAVGSFTLAADNNSNLEANNSADLTGHPDGSSNLVSGDTDQTDRGIIEGTFYIPNTSSLRFRAGRREFKLRDWNATSDENAISRAFATYTAQGLLERRSVSVTTIMPAPPVPPVRVRPIDPVAQSFVVDKPSGMFLTSVDVFFSSKSSTVPVQCQIRPVVNGTPTNAPIPGAAKFVQPENVNVSSSPDVNSASTVTTFTFDAPVYLDGLQEYAIVLMAETDAYNVWTAKMGDFKVGSTDARIMKQPAMGSFFLSQNGSTWTPDQSRDLMFRIKRASFEDVADSDSASGTAYFENPAITAARVSAIEATNTVDPAVLRVSHPNHGMVAGSSVTIAGAVAVNGVVAGAINATHTIVDADDADSYTISIAGSQASSTGVVSQSAATATQDFPYNFLIPNVREMILPEAGLSWSAQMTSGQSIAGSESNYVRSGSYEAIVPGDNNRLSSVQVVASEINETNNVTNGEKSLTFKASLSTSSDYISPVIDLSTLSASLIANKIDNPAAVASSTENSPYDYAAETDPQDGSALAKTVFVPINLDEPAVGLKVLTAVNRPANSTVELYYKFIESGSDTPLSDTSWTLATIDQAMPTDDDPDIFREYVYTIDPVDTVFATFQLKVVFKSTNSSNVPRLKDFRAIALST